MKINLISTLLVVSGLLLAIPATAQDRWLWSQDWTDDHGIGDKTLVIRQGSHGSSNLGGPRRVRIEDANQVARTFQATLRFRNSCRYGEPNGSNNFYNKVLKTASLPNSDKNSIRLGWRWDTQKDNLELATYLHLADGLWNQGPFWNTDGVYWIPRIVEVSLEQQVSVELGLTSRALWTTVNDIAWVIKNDVRDMGKVTSADWSTAHMRNAYFGGGPTAPHTLEIVTQRNVLDARPRLLTAKYRNYVHSEWFAGEDDYVMVPSSITAPAKALVSKDKGSLGAHTIIRTGAKVTFATHGEIVLLPGFSVEAGGSFHSRIVPGFLAANFGDDAWFSDKSRPVSGDFDGNFQWDIAYHGTCGNPGNPCWRVHLSDGSAFSAHNFGDDAWFSGKSQPVSGDFDGNGKWDIAYHGNCGNPGSPCWRVHLSDGSAFSAHNFGDDAWFSDKSQPVSGDFDRNGKWDIAYHGTCGNPGRPCWRVHLSDGQSFTAQNFGDDAWFSEKSQPVSGDFDGNGQWDVAYHGTCGNPGRACWRVHLSTGTSFAAHNFGDDAWFSQSNRIISGDFDGNGQYDIVYRGTCGGGSGHSCWRVHLSSP